MILTRMRRPDGPSAVVVIDEGGLCRPMDVSGIHELLGMTKQTIQVRVRTALSAPAIDPAELDVPLDGETDVWAAGVTYRRSSEARQEESDTADVYARVYTAERPELFWKSTARRAVGPHDLIGIREDSAINVPEPELAVLTNSFGEIVGAGICNDVSSRSIEGQNPLYLPQAKVYAGACAIGPGWLVVDDVQAIADLRIAVRVERDAATVWSAATSTRQLSRSLEDLVAWLHRADWFPHGAVLSTGTGLVPDLDFTLEANDVVTVTVDGIGTLSNTVAVGRDAFVGLPRVKNYGGERG